TQLFYSLALHGRAELALAPDEYAGLLMILLRWLAFRPGGSPRSVDHPKADGPAAREVAGPVGTSPRPAAPPAAGASVPGPATPAVAPVPTTMSAPAPAPVAVAQAAD